MSLSSLIVQREVASIGQVEEALARQVLYGGDLVTNLLEVVQLPEAVLVPLLAEALGMVAAPIGMLPAPTAEAKALVPEDVAARRVVMPLAIKGGRLVLVVSEPLGREAREELSFALGVRIEEQVAPSVRIREALARVYGLPLERRMARLVGRLAGVDPTMPNSLPPLKGPKASVPPLPGALSHDVPKLNPPGMPSLHEMRAVHLPEATAPAGRSQAASAAPSVPPRQPSAAPGPPAPLAQVVRAMLPRMARETKPLAGARRRGPITLAQVTDELPQVTEREALLRLFFDFGRQFFEYSAIFVVHGDIAEGRDAFGSGASREKVLAVGVPLDMPSLLRTVHERGVPVCSFPEEGGLDAVLMSDLRRAPGSQVLVVPVVVRSRVVAFFIGDDGAAGIDPSSQGEVTTVAVLVGREFERLIVRMKLQGFTGEPKASMRPPAARIDSHRVPPKPRRRDLEAREAAAQALESLVAATAPSSVSPSEAPESLTTADNARATLLDPTEVSATHEAQPDRNEIAAARATQPDREEVAAVRVTLPDPDEVAVPHEIPPDSLDAPGSFHSSGVSEPSHEILVGITSSFETLPAPPPTESPRRRSSYPPPLPPEARVPNLEPLGRQADTLRNFLGPLAADRTYEAQGVASDSDSSLRSFDSFDPAPPIDDEDALRRARHAAGELSDRPPPVQALAVRHPSGRPIPREELDEEGNPVAGYTKPERISSRPPPAEVRQARLLREIDALTASFVHSEPTGTAPPPASRGSQSFAHPPRHPPSSRNHLVLPSVIVEMDDDDAALVKAFLADPKDEQAEAQLLRQGQRAMPAIMKHFPGPLTINRDTLDDTWPRVTECGPILRLIARQRRVALPFVLERTDDADVEARFWATYLLTSLAYAEAVPSVVRRLFDESKRVRRAARLVAHILGDTAGEALVDGLDRVVRDPKATSARRVVTIDTLGEMRDPLVVPVLLGALADADEDVGLAARRGLKQVSLQDFGRDTRKWQAWWSAASGRHRIEWLIDALNHEVPALRRAAGHELKGLSEQSFEYDDLSKRERERAQQRYRDWWRREGAARFRKE